MSAVSSIVPTGSPHNSVAAAVFEEFSALIIDDNPGDQYLVQRLLMRLGIEVRAAGTAEDALQLAHQQRPDLVISDVLLPGIDGYTLVAKIRERYSDTYIPVIYITALSDEEDLLKCFAAGGDFVMTKPVSEGMLRAKLAVALRLRDLNLTLARQRDQLASYHAEMQRDIAIAKSIVDNLASEKTLAVANVDYCLQPVETLNGDLIVGAISPTGAQCFMIGDFTGHGLPAAIGVLVVHGIFCTMVAKGHTLENIAAELNKKMRHLLPVERFLSAALIEIDAGSGGLSVWNGGMPEILVRRADGSIAGRFRSTKVPLGVLTDWEFNPATSKSQLTDGDSVFIYSDGVIEATNSNGEMFDSARLEQCLESGSAETVARVMQALTDHARGARQHDDISMLEVRYDRDLLLTVDRTKAEAPVGKAATHWQFAIELGYDALRSADPVSALSSVMDALQGFGQRSAEICLIVSELFSNSLEHGLLGLDSNIKQSPQGFAGYYRQRHDGLEQLAQGCIRIEIAHAPQADGGILEIRVKHTGSGFDYATKLIELDHNKTYSGRGIKLVRSLCESLDYADGGREAIARYHWARTAQPAVDKA